ncbi:MAG TPA: hypothetical protein VHE79_12915, partial [Spirochaetia bacterium]
MTRIEIYTRVRYGDGRSLRLLPGLRRDVAAGIRGCAIVDVVLVDGVPGLDENVAAEVFRDSVAQDIVMGGGAAGGGRDG